MSCAPSSVQPLRYIPVLKALEMQRESALPFEESRPSCVPFVWDPFVLGFFMAGFSFMCSFDQSLWQNGALLNLCSWHQPDLSNTLAEDEDMSEPPFQMQKMSSIHLVICFLSDSMFGALLS